MSKPFPRWIFPTALLLTSLTSATVVTALADDAKPNVARPVAPPLGQRGKTQPSASQPSTQHLYLIRTTLLTLDIANRTGNYSVLRDSAGPIFQQKHSAADLAIAFQKVRGSVDLAPVAIRMPQLTRAPLVTPDKQLHLAGVVPGDPAPVAFEMIFEPVSGHWRLAALAVGNAQPPATRQVANSSRP